MREIYFKVQIDEHSRQSVTVFSHTPNFIPKSLYIAIIKIAGFTFPPLMDERDSCFSRFSRTYLENLHEEIKEATRSSDLSKRKRMSSALVCLFPFVITSVRTECDFTQTGQDNEDYYFQVVWNKARLKVGSYVSLTLRSVSFLDMFNDLYIHYMLRNV